MSSQQLYNQLMAEDPSERHAALAQTAALSISDFYSTFGNSLSNDTVVVDGRVFAKPRDAWLAQGSMFQLLAAKFSTVGELWAALNIDPEEYSYSRFQTDLSRLGGSAQKTKAELALQQYQYLGGTQDGFNCDSLESTVGITGEEMAPIVTALSDAASRQAAFGRKQSVRFAPSGVHLPYSYLQGSEQAVGNSYRVNAVIDAPNGRLDPTATYAVAQGKPEVRMSASGLYTPDTWVPDSQTWIYHCFAPKTTDPSPISVNIQPRVDGTCAVQIGC